MSALENRRGAAQVGLLAEAGPVEAVAVAMLRL